MTKAPTAPSEPMTQEIINRLKELLAKATDVTEADLMRYEHGGGRWAKLRDGERTLVADFYNEADREAHVAAWLALPALLSTLTNLTPSGVERIRAEAFEKMVEVGAKAIMGCNGGFTSWQFWREDARVCLTAALALPSEPPSGRLEEALAVMADALTLADNIISSSCGMDTPREWPKALQKVTHARSALQRADDGLSVHAPEGERS